MSLIQSDWLLPSAELLYMWFTILQSQGFYKIHQQRNINYFKIINMFLLFCQFTWMSWITEDLIEYDQIVKKHNCESKLLQNKLYDLQILHLELNHKDWAILSITAG